MLNAEIFANNDGFARLLYEMATIYARHGRIYGAVRLANPTVEEEEAISAFFDRDYYNQALIRISLGDFSRQLANKYPQLNFAAVLEGYLPPHGVASPPQSTKNTFAESVLEQCAKYKNTAAWPWIEEVCAMRRTYKYWVEAFFYRPQQTIEDIFSVAEILLNLPDECEPVPLLSFGAKYLQNPSDLTPRGRLGPLFMRAIAHRFNVPLPSVATATELYLMAGLVTGGSMYQVLVKNLTAYRKTSKKNSEKCKICEIYSNNGQIHVLTLENIVQFMKTSEFGMVYIIENATVFAAVCEELGSTAQTIICPHDNGMDRNPAFNRLVALLASANNKLYYAGNMDYSGLARADKLYQKYGKQFIPWRYTKEDYELMLAGTSSLLPKEKGELALLNEDLALILSQLRKTGKLPDRTQLVPLLVDDIRSGSL